jgi:protein phosphatase 1 regulatory subunit 7
VIEGLDSNIELEQLELYQNNIRSIQNLQCLTNLRLEHLAERSLLAAKTNCIRILDLSFNHIRVIENLDMLCKLEKLFLSSNKIEKVV